MAGQIGRGSPRPQARFNSLFRHYIGSINFIVSRQRGHLAWPNKRRTEPEYTGWVRKWSSAVGDMFRTLKTGNIIVRETAKDGSLSEAVQSSLPDGEPLVWEWSA